MNACFLAFSHTCCDQVSAMQLGLAQNAQRLVLQMRLICLARGSHA